MNIKLINHIFLLALTGFLVGSCSKDFLDKEPLDQRVESNFYQTQEDAQEALIAVYDALGWNTVVGFHPLPMFADIASDDSYAGGASRNDAPNIIEVDQQNIRTTNGEVLGLWRKYYIGIYRANLYLEKIQGIDADQDFIDRTVAEAKFIRAYYYLDLLRIFENVPLLTETLKSPSDYSQNQSTPEQIYNQIATDLVEAIPNLPEVIPATENGRVSKWAAKALLARAYLYVHGVYNANPAGGGKTIDQATALAELEDVIANSGHSLLANFAANFSKTGEFSSESVFEISYSDARPWYDWGYIQGGEGNIAVQMQGPRVDDPGLEAYERGWSFAPVTQSLYDAFEAGDVRRDATILSEDEFVGGLTIGYQHTGFFTKKYTTTKEYKPAEGQQELNWGNNYRVIRFSDVLLMAAELGSPNAQAYLDQVRTRAGLGSVSASLENIHRERRVELALEGHRYWDLIRQGLGVAESAISVSGVIGPGYQGDAQEFDVTFKPLKKGLFPIPQAEVDISNGVYIQNAGY
ncbi:MAG: hypothetical protein DA408_17350 [Bacteroidetes bacterium]|nr:MAG: hypothetical protein C7N36_03115 [Bacteroidota bacterium]PTM09874.1 MAG: hypothetical protein DA408_17350 [Bacteroidota bacterium]